MRCALGGQRRAPRAVVGAGAQMDDRAQAVARLVDAAFEGDLALGDDRDALAQALGMGDDVGREDHRRAGRGLVADQLLELFLVERVEPREGLVEHDQLGRWTIVPSNCTVCAMPFDKVRIGRLAQSP